MDSEHTLDEHAERLLRRTQEACREFRNGQRTLQQLQGTVDAHVNLFEGEKYLSLRTAMTQLCNKAEDVISNQGTPY